MSEKLLRIRQVQEMVPFSRTHIYRLMAASEFPKSRQMGKRAVAWLESDIKEWIDRVIGNKAA